MLIWLMSCMTDGPNCWWEFPAFKQPVRFVNDHWAATPNDHLPTAVPGPGPMAAVHPSVYYDGFHNAYPKWQDGGYDLARRPFVWDSRKGTQVELFYLTVLSGLISTAL